MKGSKAIGSRIRVHREALGMSQEELACACHVSRQTISSWENAKTLPDIQTVASLANIFDIELEELVSDEEARVAKRISADRRELKLLWIVLLGIAILYFPVDKLLEDTTYQGNLSLIIMLLFLAALAATIGRIAFLTRKHHLSNDVELGDYMLGDIKKGSADRADSSFASFVKRNYFIISIIVGMLFWFVLDVVFALSESLPATIAFAVLWIVLEILLDPSHPLKEALSNKKHRE